MILIDRKKILSILGISLIFIFAYIITGLNINNVNTNINKSIATVALPVDSKVIILDAGHGVPDERSRK